MWIIIFWLSVDRYYTILKFLSQVFIIKFLLLLISKEKEGEK